MIENPLHSVIKILIPQHFQTILPQLLDSGHILRIQLVPKYKRQQILASDICDSISFLLSSFIFHSVLPFSFCKFE